MKCATPTTHRALAYKPNSTFEMALNEDSDQPKKEPSI